jgi:hypothetical protein
MFHIFTKSDSNKKHQTIPRDENHLSVLINTRKCNYSYLQETCKDRHFCRLEVLEFYRFSYFVRSASFCFNFLARGLVLTKRPQQGQRPSNRMNTSVRTSFLILFMSSTLSAEIFSRVFFTRSIMMHKILLKEDLENIVPKMHF